MTRTLITTFCVLPLAACGSGQAIDPNNQFGANPLLPAPHEQLVADVGVFETVGWRNADGARRLSNCCGCSTPVQSA
jgi:hypothetical protein